MAYNIRNLFRQMSTNTKINLVLIVIALLIGITEYIEIKRLHAKNQELFVEVEKDKTMLTNCGQSPAALTYR